MKELVRYAQTDILDWVLKHNIEPHITKEGDACWKILNYENDNGDVIVTSAELVTIFEEGSIESIMSV